MLVPIQLCQNNMCTGFTPVPPVPAPPPQPVLPVPSGGAGAAGGGAGFYVSTPGYLDPYEPPEEAIVVEGELVEAALQQAEVRAAIARVLRTQIEPERVEPDTLIERLVRGAELKVAVDDAVQRDRAERSWEDEARLLAARLWADLQARQALRERDEAHERAASELQQSLREAQGRWQELHGKVQQLEQEQARAVPPLMLPAPVQLVVQQPAPAPDMRRLWVGVAVTAAVVAAAVFALALLRPAPAPVPAPPPAPPKRRKRVRRR